MQITSRFKWQLAVTKLYQGLLFMLMVLLVGCGTFWGGLQHSPVESSSLNQSFPAEYEVHGQIILQQGVNKEQYILIIKTSFHAVTLALLTPQGLPIWRLDSSAGNSDISRQLGLDTIVNPMQLLAYLQLIYASSADLSAVLKDNWQLDEAHSSRNFSRSPASDTILSIDYNGTGPWFSVVTLNDNALTTTITIKTLDVIHALPK
jgi:hypothetical protein